MIQLLTKSSNGKDPMYYREAYKARLREMADSTIESSVALDEMLIEETSRDETLAGAQPAGEIPSPAIAPPSSEQIKEFAAVAAKIANSLTECWSGAIAEVDRRADIDRNQLEATLKTLTPLAGKVQDLSDRVGSLSEHGELVNRNYHDLAARLFGAEERLTAYEHSLQGVRSDIQFVRDYQEEIMKRTEAQDAATANLDRTVRSQVELVETRIVPTLNRISDGLQAFTQVVDAQNGAIENLTSAGSRTDAAQRSILERLERQAQAIQSVHAAMESQAQRWGALKQAATEFIHRLGVPADDMPLPEKL
jgi:chromosome segregation ATPase